MSASGVTLHAKLIVSLPNLNWGASASRDNEGVWVDDTGSPFIVLSLLVWAFALGSTVWGTWYAILRSWRRLPLPEPAPPVSILKPCKGRDDGFETNIRSFFALDYPSFEILFSVSHGDDPAAAVVKAVMAEYPKVKARLIVGSVAVGQNPKVNNLVISYAEAAHDCLLISDSNVRVSEDYLRRIVPFLRDDVGIVTAIVAGHGGKGVGGALEATYLNSFYARWMHVSSAAGHPCVVGKSMLFRRRVLDRIGGIRALGCYVAEDYMAGKAVQKLGLRVEIAPDPIHQHIGVYGIKDFWSRHIRWGRIRKAQAPWAFLLEPAFGAVLSGLIGAFAFHEWKGVSFWAFFFAHLLVWLTADLCLLGTLSVRPKLQTYFGWAARELLAFPLWCHIALGNRIHWRGSRLRILPGGVLA